MASFLNSLRTKFGLGKHHPRLGGLEILKYIGPGLLVTVGFIDPGNWASNLAAGADYGYALLWMVTLSTVMLIVLQHNVAHLGNRDRTLPGRGGLGPSASPLFEADSADGHAGFGLDVAGRAAGRSYRVADAVRSSGPDRGGAGARLRADHAFYRLL